MTKLGGFLGMMFPTTIRAKKRIKWQVTIDFETAKMGTKRCTG
jgi:hypothetical protein